MTTKQDFLIEIGTEELPPKSLEKLSQAFGKKILELLDKNQLNYTTSKNYASPRRLAVVISDLDIQQQDQQIERKGPSVKAGFDKDGQPTKAALGFAKSCGVEISDLIKVETKKGEWLIFKTTQKGQKCNEILPELIKQSLQSLPIAKRMRWGSLTDEFVRPIHWITAIHGNEVLNFNLYNLQSSNITQGHRFHHPENIVINKANDYETVLKTKGFVIADLETRKNDIKNQVEALAKSVNGKAILDENLLQEVTGLVEWPIAILGEFDTEFLQVPKEVLISSMQSHQKYFAVVNKDNNIMPYFITIANIDSKDHNVIKEGNEKVIRPRLADAVFFWERDKKIKLSERVDQLKNVIFQKQLGSIYDKSCRIKTLSFAMADILDCNKEDVERAAMLCKTDLMTEMVGEFPDLQGIMGQYYAHCNDEKQSVSIAMNEQYQPRFSGDILPESSIGQIISIADKVDTIAGIFSTGKKPTGDKDPFGLRRASIGVIRILIEKKLDINIDELIKHSCKNFDNLSENKTLETEVYNYISDRLTGYFLDCGFSIDVIDAVISSRKLTILDDTHNRLIAVRDFIKQAESVSLISANKRIRNILKKSDAVESTIDEKLLQDTHEINLVKKLNEITTLVNNCTINLEYNKSLTILSELKITADDFFNNVMVMADDEKIKFNRLAILNNIQNLFLQIADLSKLQSQES
ncbi:MAG: glycine--tRNA ligase subunit beta [Methylococcales bacterium]|jgi:glycyl-tRNA synthetase beta chain|nr:glycine--tRNA ligase subunit beta [Methylococcales bacterium]